jgi:hypothetical protein
MQVEKLGPPRPVRTFADLQGLLAGIADSTEEEIDAALYRFDWQEEESEATGA